MMLLARGFTLPEAYHYALCVLHNYGELIDCPDWETKCLDTSIQITVANPLAEPMISRCFPGGFRDLEKYRMEMLDGILDFEVALGNWAYTYHDRMGYQIDAVIRELKRNPQSRRAVINICNPDDMNTADPPCLQNIQFRIEEGNLDCYVLFRSNDAVKATFMNAYALIRLQERIANAVGVPVGYYTHTANSFHCYERDLPVLESYVKRIINASEDDLTYRYRGDWDALMDAERNGILADLEIMKNRLGIMKNMAVKCNVDD